MWPDTDKMFLTGKSCWAERGGCSGARLFEAKVVLMCWHAGVALVWARGRVHGPPRHPAVQEGERVRLLTEVLLTNICRVCMFISARGNISTHTHRHRNELPLRLRVLHSSCSVLSSLLNLPFFVPKRKCYVLWVKLVFVMCVLWSSWLILAIVMSVLVCSTASHFLTSAVESAKLVPRGEYCWRTDRAENDHYYRLCPVLLVSYCTMVWFDTWQPSCQNITFKKKLFSECILAWNAWLPLSLPVIHANFSSYVSCVWKNPYRFVSTFHWSLMMIHLGCHVLLLHQMEILLRYTGGKIKLHVSIKILNHIKKRIHSY